VLDPTNPASAGLGILSSFAFGLPIIAVDMVLLCRVVAVVPPSATSKRVLAAVYTFPLLTKVAQCALIVEYAILYYHDIRHGDQHYGSDKTEVRNNEAAWILNVLENACAHSSQRAAY
jgi:hypothetical protein